MKQRILPLLVAVTISLASPLAWGQPEAVPPPTLNPHKGALENVEGIRVTFSTPMVELEAVRREGQRSPIIFTPAVRFNWVWLSQSEGKIDIITPEEGRGVSQITYFARLPPKLKDLDGKLVGPETWSVEYTDPGFELTSMEIDGMTKWPNEREEEDQPDQPEENDKPDPSKVDDDKDSSSFDFLSARPRVRLEFSRDVDPKALARTAHFLDRESNQRFPVEVNLEGRQQMKPQGWLYLEPANPLPPDRSYLLVIDGLKDARYDKPLPKLIAISAGRTYSPKVIDVRGYHQPLKGAFFRVAANQSFDPEASNLRAISVTPAVADIRLVPTGNGFEGRGSFKAGVSYKVVLKAGLRSASGLPLKEDSAWDIKIPSKRPSVIFPEEYIYQRASTGWVRIPFTHVNTEQLTWKLARIPASQFSQVHTRLREFETLLHESEAGNLDKEKNIVSSFHKLVYDKETGDSLFDKTVPLIPEFDLPVLAQGEIERSGGDEETIQTIEWRASDNLPDLLLLEVSGKDSLGRLVGNRVIVSRTDWMINSISSHGSTLRVFRMDDGKPAPGVRLEVLKSRYAPEDGDTPKKIAFTDANGQAEPDMDIYESTIMAGPVERPCLLHIGNMGFHVGGYRSYEGGDGVEGLIVTDRNVYFPGETVQYQGYIRVRKDGILGSFPDETVKVTIAAGDDTEDVMQESQKQVSAGGAFPGEWKIPTDAYGDYTINVSGESISANIKVAEFRPPPFTCIVETRTTTGRQAIANVSSMLYHGAPNQRAKVRWKAEWVADNWRGNAEEEESQEGPARSLFYQLDDLYSPDSPTRGVAGKVLQELQKAGWDTTEEDSNGMVAGVVQGEETSDENGQVTLKCDCPFPNTTYARFKVYWVVDVTSAVTAQTVRGGSVAKVQTVPQVLAVALLPVNSRTLALNVASINSEEALGRGVKAKAEVFAMKIKTTKEQISPGFHRYVNIPLFTKVWEEALVTPVARDIEMKEAGEYVVRVTAAGVPQVSDTALVAEGEDEIEIAVRSDTDLEVSVPKPIYDVGQTIPVTIKSPVLGPAILSVEARDVLHTEQIEIRGNVTTFSLKVDEAYAPNVWITVHQITPAADGGLPGERFGACSVKIELPERRLDVGTMLEQTKLQPGEMARGIVKVSQLGAPIPNAEVLVFAVDESVLQLGKWKLPDFKETFFPQRGWGVTTSAALSAEWMPLPARELSHGQKGFILGDYGSLMDMAYFRREFQALAYWNPLLKTNDEGEVAFEFKTPDSLTSYRVITVVHEGTEKFGQNKTMLQVNKPLQVEPVLPAFLRQGDQVSLRTSLRQDYADSDELVVGVKINAGLQLKEPATKRVTVRRGQPIIVNFSALVSPGATRANIGFAAWSAQDRQIQDSEERSFTIHPKAVGRQSVVTGVFDRASPVDVRSVVPVFWKQAEGKADVILSGSSLLPKLAGIYDLLEAQGSTEKLATRVLAITLISEASDFLPLAPASKEQMRQRLEEGLKLLLSAEVWGGGLASWPTDRGSLHPTNDFATIEGAWAIRNAAAKFEGVAGDATLRKADRWLSKIIHQEYPSDDATPSARCYALMAYSHSFTKRDEVDAEGMQSAIADLFQNRDEEKLNVQDRAWLALAMHYLDMLPDERRTLLRELQKPIDQTLFNPAFFDSELRVEAARLLARSELESVTAGENSRKQIMQAFENIAGSSVDLSTQDNLWLLLLFNSLMKGEVPAQIAKYVTPTPPTTSPNRISAGWMDVPLARLEQTFVQPVSSQVPGSYLLRANVEEVEASSPVSDPDFNIIREARNLTARERTGKPESPWKPGDQILLTYRISTTQQHSHLEFDDQLPACLEVVNPDLPAIAENFKLRVEAGVNQLKLAHRELRFAHTVLYFDKAPPGVSTYSVLARVNVSGSFTWPATRVQAMYDRRFYASSQSNVVHSQ